VAVDRVGAAAAGVMAARVPGHLDAAGAARVGLAEVELTIRSLADLERAQPLLLASYESS
jgi:hypothetical protein